MNQISTILRVALGLVLLAILIPLFVWVGIAALGFMVVIGIVGAIAGRIMMRRQGHNSSPFEASAFRATHFHKWRTERRGPIIDHE